MDARTLCLGVINDQPATGYDIKKAVEAGPFQHFFGISYGSIYPTLNRLLEDGDVAISDQAVDGGHPSKRRFEITEKGRSEFYRQLATADTRDKLRSEFVLSLFYFDQLKVQDRIAILERRIHYLEDDLDEIIGKGAEVAQCAPQSSRQKLIDFAQRMRRAELEYLREYRAELLAERPVDSRSAAHTHPIQTTRTEDNPAIPLETM